MATAKKMTLSSWLTAAAFVVGLVGLILYFVNASTGYFKGNTSTGLVVSAIIGLIAYVCIDGYADGGAQKNALADATIRFAPAVVAGLVLAAIVLLRFQRNSRLPRYESTQSS